MASACAQLLLSGGSLNLNGTTSAGTLTQSGGTLGGTGGGWLATSSDRTVTLTATAGQVADAMVDYEVASDSAGTDVLGTGAIEMHAEST